MAKLAETIENAIGRISRLSAPEQIVKAVDALHSELGKHNYLEFLAGRALLEAGKVREAIPRLKSSVELNPKFPWARYEFARALFANGDHSNALRELGDFLRNPPKDLAASCLEVCERIADAGVTAGFASDAFPSYPLILKVGSKRPLTRLRAFEAALQQGDLELASRLRSVIEAPKEPWGHLAFAWHSGLLRDTESMLEHLEKAHALVPDNLAAALRTAHLLRHLPADDALRAWTRFHANWRSHFAPEDVEVLKLESGRMVLQSRAITVDLLLALKSKRMHKFHAIEYLYLNSGLAVEEKSHGLFPALLQHFGPDADILECIVNVHIVNRMYQEARASCSVAVKLTGDPDQKFKFKLFEIECFDNNLEYANQLLAQLDQQSLGSLQLLMVARMRAEQGQWEAAANILEELVRATDDLSAELVDLTVRTARKLAAQQRFVNVVAGKPATPSRQRLLSALLEDWSVQPGGRAKAAKVLKSTAMDASPMLALKMEVVGPKTRSSASTDAKRAVFYCADRAYVLPAVVSMVSLLQSNPSLHTADYFLVIDDALAKQVQSILTKVGRQFGVEVQVVKASAICANVSKLNARYGIFTGGHQLAKSAYYRIYMARMLAESKRYGELIYVDSDTLVLDGFDSLTQLERDAKTLLMARPEIDRPEIRKATAAHGLAPGAYFNSGILYFPSVKSQTIARLKDAERIAEQESQRLLFQDQCALNLAFKGCAAPLPTEYNYFVAPDKAHAFASVPRGVPKLIHTLDRPKPWDSLYPQDTAVQRLWINSVRSLHRMVGAESVERMFEWTFGS